jgi:hypothetical protein
MIDELQTALRDLLPLRIDSIEWNEPTATIVGSAWALSATCAWRLTRGPALICSSADPHADVGLGELVGQEITAVTRQGCTGPAIDPAFHITGDLYLEIFSDTDWDPWVLRLPAVTYVGSASTPPDPPAADA